MLVIRKAPGQPPELVVMENTLEALQQAVGGYIETVSFCEDALVICNEEGRLQGLPYNCDFLGISFVGPILIVGVDGDEMCSLDDGNAALLLYMLGRAAP
ncbi:DUF3846 domain-containing protein [Fournierella sp.]|uniref:DUF3846 domain-containing protein n=1 Tax=Allofournierella sp. TaxID=1940256 RepID=UPI0025C70DB8|nr:DUF3846 domain-containing protein [Fournierella sp.]